MLSFILELFSSSFLAYFERVSYGFDQFLNVSLKYAYIVCRDVTQLLFFFFSFFSKHLCVRFDFDSFLLFLCEIIFVFLNFLKEAGFKIAFLTSQAPSFGVSLYSHLLFCELLSLSPSCFYLDLLTPPPLSGCYSIFVPLPSVSLQWRTPSWKGP